MPITLYHNPKCGTSREVLSRLRAAGHEPRIVEYLKTPLSKVDLKALVKKTGEPVRAIVRTKEALYNELHLETANDEQLFEAMANHPILMNRPIVETKTGAKLCRPAESVSAFL